LLGGLVTILNAIREKVKHCHPIITYLRAGGYNLLGAVSNNLASGQFRRKLFGPPINADERG
jgi:hypothetical protein